MVFDLFKNFLISNLFESKKIKIINKLITWCLNDVEALNCSLFKGVLYIMLDKKLFILLFFSTE